MSKGASTGDLIAHLVEDLPRPSEARVMKIKWIRGWGAWAFGFALFTAFLIWCWPAFTYGPTEWAPRAMLWLALFLSAGGLAYRSAVPLSDKRRLLGLITLSAVALLLSTWSLRTNETLAAEFRHELEWGRGPCGILIALGGVGAGLAALGRLRAGASVRPLTSGLWTGVAAGALGAFFMQLICRHETTAHVLLWHALPIAPLATALSLIARRRLFPR